MRRSFYMHQSAAGRRRIGRRQCEAERTKRRADGGGKEWLKSDLLEWEIWDMRF